MTNDQRRYRAGEPVQDLCRACHTPRDHTVIAADDRGRPLRVVCGFCGSQHNYRGGGDEESARRTPGAAGDQPRLSGKPFDLVTDRERTEASMTSEDTSPVGLETMLRRIIREESSLTTVVPAEKWRDGQLVLRPANPSLQEKAWPIETFFHKVVMLRNRLRTLEQQVNGSDLPEDQKIKLQTYVTACYGSLTSFNVLFADEDNHFRGAGGG